MITLPNKEQGEKESRGRERIYKHTHTHTEREKNLKRGNLEIENLEREGERM